MKINYSLLFLISILSVSLTLITISCGSDQKNKQTNTPTSNDKSDSSKVEVAQNDSNEEKAEQKNEPKIKASFKIDVKNVEIDGMESISTDVFLLANGRSFFLANIPGEGSIMDLPVPKEAISACGAWWAGAGDYFYVAPSKKGVTVFRGWQDEGQTDNGYHWKKFKEFAL